MISLFSVFIDLGFNYRISLPNKNGIELFISQFAEFKVLYSSTIAIIVAYIALKNYIYNKRKDVVIETYKTIDSYFTTINSNIQDIIEKIREKEICKNKSIVYNDFTVEALEKEDYNKILDLIKNPSFRQSVNSITSTLDIVSYKYVNEYVDKNIVVNSIGNSFVSYVNALYPVISVSRTREKGIPPLMINYENIVIMYNEISKKITVANTAYK
jgi:hypothetical protein